MGLDIIVPVIAVVILAPMGFVWARRTFKDGAGAPVELVPPPSARLTSDALRSLPSPPWRVVYEIAAEKLGGIEHVLIGPGGIFAIQTSMDPLPVPADPEPQAVARAAVARGPLDDALRRCAMSSTSLTVVHWGVGGAASGAVEVMPGVIAVDGRHVGAWAAGLPASALSPAQIDLAWQTVVTAIGRPDPLR